MFLNRSHVSLSYIFEVFFCFFFFNCHNNQVQHESDVAKSSITTSPRITWRWDCVGDEHIKTQSSLGAFALRIPQSGKNCTVMFTDRRICTVGLKWDNNCLMDWQNWTSSYYFCISRRGRTAILTATQIVLLISMWKGSIHTHTSIIYSKFCNISTHYELLSYGIASGFNIVTYGEKCHVSLLL